MSWNAGVVLVASSGASLTTPAFTPRAHAWRLGHLNCHLHVCARNAAPLTLAGAGSVVAPSHSLPLYTSHHPPSAPPVRSVAYPSTRLLPLLPSCPVTCRTLCCAVPCCMLSVPCHIVPCRAGPQCACTRRTTARVPRLCTRTWYDSRVTTTTRARPSSTPQSAAFFTSSSSLTRSCWEATRCVSGWGYAEGGEVLGCCGGAGVSQARIG